MCCANAVLNRLLDEDSTIAFCKLFQSGIVLGKKLNRIRFWGRILVQVTIYCRLLIGRDGHLDQSEAYDIS